MQQQFDKKPLVCPSNFADREELMAKAYNQTVYHFNSHPMFMVFVVNDRNFGAGTWLFLLLLLMMVVSCAR